VAPDAPAEKGQPVLRRRRPRRRIATPMTPPCCPPGSHGALDPSSAAYAGQYVHTESGVELYITKPSGAVPPAGFIIVFHDIFGMRSGHHARVCDDFAAASKCIVVMPDCFGDAEKRAANTASFNVESTTIVKLLRILFLHFGAFRSALSLTWKDVAPATRAALTYAFASAPDVADDAPIFCVGFCWGTYPSACLLSEGGAADVGLADASRLRGGVAIHPALLTDKLVSGVRLPLLLCPCVGDASGFWPGGAFAAGLERAFAKSRCGNTPDISPVVPFAERHHGFMTRGKDLDDPNSDDRKDSARAVEVVRRFIEVLSASEYVWHGHGLGWIMGSVPEIGCALPTGQEPVMKLTAEVPFTVYELRHTARGAQGEHKVYGRVESPAAGWVDLTTFQCEKVGVRSSSPMALNDGAMRHCE
jgi:dienelactone hydrolase